MLAPGEYLLMPVVQPDSVLSEPRTAQPAGGEKTNTDTAPNTRRSDAGDVPASTPSAEPEAEPRSFLSILLTALGAIHS